MIDGGRFDRALKSNVFNKIQKDASFFSNSITYGPHTIAAMHAVFSGTYGNRNGTNSYWSTFKFKKNKFKTLTEYLHEENFYTCCDIVSELVIPRQGFDEFLIHDENKDDLFDKHSNLLDQMKAKNNNQNFFLYLQYSNIHTGISNEVLKVYDNFSEEFFQNREKNIERYDRLFAQAEIYLERIMNKIYELNLDKNSIILIMSDHGISTGEKIGERAYGAFCYDYTLHTFTYFLGSNFPSKEITQQIRTIDFLPTILESLDIPLDESYEKIDGVSLLPLLNNNPYDEKIAFSETGNPLDSRAPPKEPNTHSVRTSDWKLIINDYNNTIELYNLKADPDETKNVSGEFKETETFLLKEYEKISSL